MTVEGHNTFDSLNIEDPEWEFDPNKDYTPSQLDALADMILRADAKAGNKIRGEHPILFQEHLKNRHKREIYNRLGYPDPSIEQGIYYRTHPEGRKVNSEEARKKHGAAYYR